MKRVHYTDSYLLNPQHPVTVNLIGAGGTGSQVLTCLARLDVTLRGLGHPGLFVTLYDPDIVTEANIGRQLFGYSYLGLNKAQCLITRINNFFGNDWKAVPALYPSNMKDARQENLANITITCTDNIKSRIDLWNILKTVPAANYTNYQTPLYWLDFGNTQTTGQVVLGTVPKKIKQPASKLYRTVIEGHHQTRKVCKNQGGRLRPELLACRSVGEAGSFHQLHVGSTRLQHSMETVPLRHDRAPRALSQPQHDESQSDNGINGWQPSYSHECDGFLCCRPRFIGISITNIGVLFSKMPLKCY